MVSMNRKSLNALKVYPFYRGFTGDLLFYVAIDTLFLTMVKQFSNSQVISITSVSTIVSLALRSPILWFVKKFGNRLMLRVGAFCLFLSSVLITFGSTFPVVVLGKSFRNITVLFNDIAGTVTLENNLEQEGRHEDFAKFFAQGNMFYSVLTLGISVVAPTMFNINPYLPMYCCIGTSAIGFVLSFFASDFSEKNNVVVKQATGRVKPKIVGFILLALILYGLCATMAMRSITDAKLFMQQDLLKIVDLQKTTSIIGAIYFLSRIVRLLSNFLFVRIYRKCRLATIFVYTSGLVCAFVALLLGSALTPLYAKAPVLACGYFFVLFAVDPIKMFVQQVIIRYTPNEQHRDWFSYMGLLYDSFMFVLSTVFSVVVAKHSMNSEMWILLTMAVATVVLAYTLVCILKKRKPVEQ